MHKRTVNPTKSARVDALKRHASEAKSIAVVDYSGLNVAQATELRKNIKSAGGEMKIEKNTLFKLALDKDDLNLEGLSAFIFSKSDEVAALKTLLDFMKKSGVGKFKIGFLGDRILTAEEVEALAKTPNKEALAAKLLAGLNSPLHSLTYSLNFNISQLIRVLDAIRQKEVN